MASIQQHPVDKLSFSMKAFMGVCNTCCCCPHKHMPVSLFFNILVQLSTWKCAFWFSAHLFLPVFVFFTKKQRLLTSRRLWGFLMHLLKFPYVLWLCHWFWLLIRLFASEWTSPVIAHNHRWILPTSRCVYVCIVSATKVSCRAKCLYKLI